MLGFQKGNDCLSKTNNHNNLISSEFKALEETKNYALLKFMMKT